ncbi:hypothetical protein HKX48_003021 [Thoreauomyces humboldtii]|nr:hypothetical protein HKX48_003021 [Thoreauomyces humboldtii]
MVACSQPLAAAAGIEILNAGGNAADAAVAVSAALNLVEPGSCGIGGDAFCLFYDAKDRSVKGLNGSGRAPKALSLAKARELGITGKYIEPTNINAVTVPGCAAAWDDTITWFGSGKITLAQALAPAIRMAESGVPISEHSSHQWRRNHKRFLDASPNFAEMLIVEHGGNTHAPAAGEIYTNLNLAKTFRALAERGKEGFYEGPIAESIVDLIQSQGGVMTLEDLKSHTTLPVTPISYNYGGSDGVTLHECPPNGQGITALIALGIVEALEDSGVVDLTKMPLNSAMWLHTLIECTRLAFADTRALVTCPDVMQKETVERLLSKPYLASRAKLFDPKGTTAVIRRGIPTASSDTVLFTVADESGSAMSYIQSNYHGFGTSAIPKGTGFTLQNRGCGFTLEDGHANELGDGGRRPFHTIIPAVVTRGTEGDRDLFMAYGVMGGFMQPQGHLQVLLNVVACGLDVQAALDVPRFCVSPDVPDDRKEGDIGSLVYLEEGIAEDVVEQLRGMGHSVKVLKGHARQMFGRGQIIMKSAGGCWAGGSDPRADGHAVPQI